MAENRLGTIDFTQPVYPAKKVDELLALKQDVLVFDDTPTGGSQNPVTSTGIKSYVDSSVADLGKVLNWKGSVPTYADLPTENVHVGDVYNIEEDGMNVAATEVGSNDIVWDPLGPAMDMYLTKAEAVATYATLVNVMPTREWDGSAARLHTYYNGELVKYSGDIYRAKGNFMQGGVLGLPAGSTLTPPDEDPTHWEKISACDAINKKVEKEEGKGLSTNDFTNEDAEIVEASAEHMLDTENPHQVTKSQVGLGNVDNTSDLNKPVSTAVQSALDLKADASSLTSHVNNTDNPHQVTKSQVGLGDVDNTSDLNKPVSTATQTALDGKVSRSGDTMTGNLTVQATLTVGTRSGSSGQYSVTFGNTPTASGPNSHAQGYQTQAKGQYSHAEGAGTIVSGISSHAEGRYNADHTSSSDAGNALHMIGFGTSNSDRKNAVETMRDGKTYLYNVGGYNGTNPTGTGVKDLAAVVNGKLNTAGGTMTGNLVVDTGSQSSSVKVVDSDTIHAPYTEIQARKIVCGNENYSAELTLPSTSGTIARIEDIPEVRTDRIISPDGNTVVTSDNAGVAKITVDHPHATYTDGNDVAHYFQWDEPTDTTGMYDAGSGFETNHYLEVGKTKADYDAGDSLDMVFTCRDGTTDVYYSFYQKVGGGNSTAGLPNGHLVFANGVCDHISVVIYENEESVKTLATTDQLPTVNNATLTIQKEGTSVGTFTANASSNVTVNIVETDPVFTYWKENVDPVVIGNEAVSYEPNSTVAIGRLAKANGTGDVVIGPGADAAVTAGSYGNTVIGNNASASSNYGVAVGVSAATSLNAVAIGHTATASNENAIAIRGTAAGSGSITMGLNSSTTQYTSYAIAIGQASQVRSGGNSISIGAQAHVGNTNNTAPVNSVALGFDATVDSSTANGPCAQYGVALGAGAIVKAAPGLSGNPSTVQLGSGTNTDQGTLQFRSYQLLDKDGKIPADRLANANGAIQSAIETEDPNIATKLTNLRNGNYSTNDIVVLLDTLYAALGL